MKSWHSSYLLDLQISILSTQPTYFASCQLKPPSFFHVDMFPLTANFSFSNRVVSYPKSAPSRKLLVFKLFSYIYFSTFDINTTVSTWLDWIGWMSFPTLRAREHIHSLFRVLVVCGNISTKLKASRVPDSPEVWNLSKELHI